MPTVTPFLWYHDNNAEEAVDFYVSIFKDGKKTKTSRWGEGAPFPSGSVLAVEFTIMGQDLIAFNGGPHHKFSESFSLFIRCETQEEIDYYWNGLLQGGSAIQCGWLKDKYGLCWQVAPRDIMELTKHPKAMKAMMGMIKLDIAALKAASAV
jgi:predicted 3-demethylubiquinone-9 3-methyltransferase (glyoxalase superfamily)